MDRFRYVVPVCCDALGKTWLGFADSGAESARPVTLTICSHTPESLEGRHLIESAVSALTVRHPNALAFLEVAHAPDCIALVGEHIEGQPLSSLLRASANDGNPIPPGVALQIVRESLETLAALNVSHPNAVEHGGFCPDAVFVAAYGETMLRQPGIVSAAMKLPEFRRHPSSMPYQAPEFIRDARENEETADVFSAGVMLWEMLVGRPLFGARDHKTFGRLATMSPGEAAQIERRVLSMKIPSVARVRRAGQALHPELIRVVDWALQKDPAARPQSTAELTRAIASLPVELHATSYDVAQTVRELAGHRMAERARRLNKELQSWREAGVQKVPSRSQPISLGLELDPPDSESGAFEIVQPACVADAPATELDSPALLPPPAALQAPHAQSPQSAPRKRLPSAPNSEALIPAPIPERTSRPPMPPVPLYPVSQDAEPFRSVAAEQAAGPYATSSLEPSQKTTPLMWLAAAVMLFCAGAGSSYALFSSQTESHASAEAENIRLAPQPDQVPAAAAPVPSPELAPTDLDSAVEPSPDEAPSATDSVTNTATKPPSAASKKAPSRKPAAADPDRDAPFRPSGL